MAKTRANATAAGIKYRSKNMGTAYKMPYVTKKIPANQNTTKACAVVVCSRFLTKTYFTKAETNTNSTNTVTAGAFENCQNML